MKFLSLLVAAVLSLATMAKSDCLRPKERILNESEIPLWKSDARHINKKVDETVAENGLCNVDSHEGMWTVAMVINQNWKPRVDSNQHYLTFVVMNENCVIKGIWEAQNSDKGGDCEISSDAFAQNPKSGRDDKLKMYIDRYSYDTNNKDRDGSFAFTYGSYHGETSYNSDLTSSSYPSCHKLKQGEDWKVSACRHRFPKSPSVGKRAIEFSS